MMEDKSIMYDPNGIVYGEGFEDSSVAYAICNKYLKKMNKKDPYVKKALQKFVASSLAISIVRVLRSSWEFLKGFVLNTVNLIVVSVRKVKDLILNVLGFTVEPSAEEQQGGFLNVQKLGAV